MHRIKKSQIHIMSLKCKMGVCISRCFSVRVACSYVLQSLLRPCHSPWRCFRGSSSFVSVDLEDHLALRYRLHADMGCTCGLDYPPFKADICETWFLIQSTPNLSQREKASEGARMLKRFKQSTLEPRFTRKHIPPVRTKVTQVIFTSSIFISFC